LCFQGTKALIAATKAVRDSKAFKQYLELLLAVGNYLNGGFRGGAYGFKYDGILKLTETKSNSPNPEHTLQHYIVEIVHRKFSPLLDFLKDLEPCISASKSR